MHALLLLALTPGIARAESPACTPLTFHGTQPFDGASGVPIDVQPVLLFAGDCSFPLPLDIHLFEDGVDEPVWTYTATVDDVFSVGQHFGVTVDPGPLDDETTYRMDVTQDYLEPITSTFQTSDLPAPPLDNGPTLVIDDLRAEARSGRSLRLDFDVVVGSGLDDPDVAALSTWLVREEGAVQTMFVAPAAGEPVEMGWTVPRAQNELCLTVEERDAVGRFSGSSQVVCAAIPLTRGCSTTPAPMLAGLLALLAAPFIRRRNDASSNPDFPPTSQRTP